MSQKSTALLVLLTLNAITAIPYLTENDRRILKNQFAESLVFGIAQEDLQTAFHSFNGLTSLGEKIDAKLEEKYCSLVQLKSSQAKDIQTANYVATTKGCKLAKSDVVAKLAKDALANAQPSSSDVFYAASTLKAIGLPVDAELVNTAITAALKKDDTSSSLAYAFHASSFLDVKHVGPLFSRIEDLVGQADEVDKKFLQYEGGLSVTAIAVSGIFKLATAAGKAPTVKAEDLIKFTSYLLNRRTPRSARQAHLVFEALTALATNQYQVPVSVTLDSDIAVSSTSRAPVRIKVCDVLGRAVSSSSVTADSALFVETQATVLSKVPVVKMASDTTNTLFELKFVDLLTSAQPGFYTLTVSASSPDKRFIGGASSKISLKLMSTIKLINAELYTQERDANAPAANNIHKLTSPNKLGKKLEVDYHQKLGMRFTVVDTSDKQLPVTVHQAFAIFTHKQAGKEVIFVAESDASAKNVYKWEVDLGKLGSTEFDQLNGDYEVRLVVGSANVENPVDWKLTDVSLKFSSLDDAPESSGTADPLAAYNPLPEIKHMFREPEKRPPAALSSLFTLLVVVVPALVLLIGWPLVGFNFGNMPLSPFTLGFHIGLGAILGLYAVFWLRLDMFVTLKYLALIGSITFVCGNVMLRSMAERRRAKVAKND